jgi:polar amino acid transport system permease protein
VTELAAETSGLAAPTDIRRPWTKARITGHVLLGLWIAAGVWLVLHLILGYDAAFYARYAPKFLNGTIVTLEIVSLSLVIGAAISLPVAFGRISPNPLAAAPSFAYVYFFRGTPLIAQTFLVYYGAGTFRVELEAIGLWWFFRDAFNCVIFTFALNTSAYQAEILSGAIRNVPRGQVEAATALGLRRWVAFYKVVLPQALIVALRPYGNEIVLMIKGSAVASIVTVFDLMGETRRAYSRSFDFETYIWAAIIYLIMVEVLRRVWDLVEQRLTRHLKRDGPAIKKPPPAG